MAGAILAASAEGARGRHLADEPLGPIRATVACLAAARTRGPGAWRAGNSRPHLAVARTKPRDRADAADAPRARRGLRDPGGGFDSRRRPDRAARIASAAHVGPSRACRWHRNNAARIERRGRATA